MTIPLEAAEQYKKNKRFLAGFTPLESPLKLDGKNNQKRQERKAPLFLTGFTLIETIMVIVILGILAALTIPKFNSFYGIKLSGAIKKVRSDIRYVQQLGISQHMDTRIVFDTANNSYQASYCTVSGGVCGNSWAAITDPFTRGNLQAYFNTDPQYRGIDLTGASFGGTSTLRFDWQGVPQNSSRVNLAADGSASFSYQGNSSTVYITPNTGRIRIQ